MDTFESILKSLQGAAPRPYTPAFRLEAEGDAWHVFDGDRPLAKFYPLFLDIWALSPFEPDIKANPEPPGAVVDLHTVHNTFLNLGMQGWPRHWRTDAVRWNWERTTGAELVAVISLEAQEGETARWRLAVGYNPARTQYTWRVVLDARKLDSDGFEGFNLMTAGALEDRPEKRRWTHSVWENPDGALRRIVHSNALFQCTDYGGMRNGGGPWRGRHLPYPRAWMAYAAHPVFNPALLIHATTVPLQAATCSSLFDEHIVFSRAGQDNLGEDGYFHFHMNLEFVSLPAALAKELLEQAADPVRPKKWWNETLALPFHVDAVNSFEDAVDPWQPEDCPIVEVPRDGAGPVAWTDEAAHSGKRSLRLRQEKAGRLAAFPTGAVCKVTPHTRYRFAAWVKTATVTGAAKIEFAGYAYSYNNISHMASSCELHGSNDWTKLEVELNSGDQAYLMPYLVLEGSGTAWFDDVRLEKIL